MEMHNMSDVTLAIDIDITKGLASVALLQGAVDKQQQEWSISRQQIMQGLTAVNQAISVVSQLARLTAKATGQAMNKVLSSLITVTQATISSLLAIGTAYTATGILAPIGAILIGFASGLSLGQAIFLFQKEAELAASFITIDARLAAIEAAARSAPFGGGGTTG